MGEAQAESYLRGLHTHLHRLCDNRLLWLPQRLAVPSGMKHEAYFSRYVTSVTICVPDAG